jgi:UDP-glucose 6-dehydrogenase
MNFINAEITKLATYITTRISYANMIARLCEKLPEADTAVVTNAVGLDTRIGPPWQEFREVPAAQWARQNRPRAVIDCWRVLNHL